MSQCREDKTPGPVTIVHGLVREAKTGIPLANIQLQIEKEYAAFLSPNRISDYDITTTGADGSYSFSNLGPGSYSVQEVVPAGSTQTGGNAGYTTSATSGTNSTGNNFDNFQNITISGKKYNDLTNNGITADDTGLGGVRHGGQ